jgi:hypothetical protein
MTAVFERRLVSREKARIRSAPSDGQPNSFGTARAIALVGGLIAVDINPRVNVAASKVNTYEAARGARRCTIALERIVGYVKILTNHHRPTYLLRVL